MDKANPACTCVHHHIAPLLIVLIGLDFLLNALGFISDGMLAISWPILLIIAGAIKLTGRRCSCCGTH